MNLKEKKSDFKVKTDEKHNRRSMNNKFKNRIQKIGSFMAGMIMPTVGILIAWGLFAAMFLGGYNDDGDWVATGWFNFEPMGIFIAPTMKYLIPILIGYTAGNMIYGIRGGMFGAFLTFAAIIGNDFIYQNYISHWRMGAGTVADLTAPNQIVGAMVIAPLFVWCAKKIEDLYLGKIKPGFEMLVRNFSQAGIAMAFCLAVFFSWGFVMYGISFVMVEIIELFTRAPWAFPFISIFSEPLRAVFLNNALNWGVMIPIGMQEVEMGGPNGFSPFFMVGGNPGPGFGLLIAYTVWRKQQRGAAAGSSVIQLVGGIHEVHYVYILAEPIMILSTMGGAFASLSIVGIFGGGAIGPISPGSMISVIAMSGTWQRILINLIALFTGALASFGIATLIMLFKRKSKSDKGVMNISVTDEGVSFGANESKPVEVSSISEFNWSNAKTLVVACDAGMGSSAMAAGIIKKWCKQNDIDIVVSNRALKDLDPAIDIIVTMINFVDIAKEKAPTAYIYPVKQFLGAGIFDDLYQNLEKYKKINK